jgi:hypothetical protein
VALKRLGDAAEKVGLAFERRQGKIQFNSKDRGFRTRTGQAPELGPRRSPLMFTIRRRRVTALRRRRELSR